MEIKQKTKQEVLAIANDLEEKAKDEEIGWVRFFDLRGGYKTFTRYELPYVAEGMRKQAMRMVG